MTNIHFDSADSDDQRRRRLYAGDLYLYSPMKPALELVSRRLAQALRKLEGAVQKLVKQELEGREVAKNRRSSRLSERNFSLLTPEEVGRMETTVRRLAERLKGFSRTGPSKLFRKFVDTPGNVEITQKEVIVRLGKKLTAQSRTTQISLFE